MIFLCLVGISCLLVKLICSNVSPGLLLSLHDTLMQENFGASM